METNLKSEIQTIISKVILEDPFLGLLLKKTWIYEDESIETAITDGLSIVINPKFFAKLQPHEKVFVLEHELLHIILKHTIREKEYLNTYGKILDPMTLNVIADGKVNQYLTKFEGLIKTIKPVWPDDIKYYYNILYVEEKSFEEIISELIRKKKFISIKLAIHDVFRKNNRGTKERKVINEGDKEDKSEQGAEERLKSKLSETLITIKSMGKDPGNWERVVNQLIKPSINWKRILRLALTKGSGLETKRTWFRPSRKLPDIYPGKETLMKNKVLVLIDTSGSISETELKKFVSEVYNICRETNEVIVIPWDTIAYNPIVIKSSKNIKELKLKGGGGTKIKNALEKAKSFKDVEKIVIFSDWWIYDIDDNETEKLLKELSRKIIAFSTAKDPPSYLKSYKIKVGGY